VSRREKINEVLRSVSKNPGTPGEEESLFEAGYLDSFALTDLVSGLEQTFGVQVPDKDLTPRKFDTIAKIDAYLESRGA
jgi:acyl carrier protein